MGLLDTIRSLLGLDRGGADRDRSEGGRATDVRLEREPDDRTAPETGSEAAVKGTDDSPEHEDEPVTAGTDAADEPVAAETDAAASTDSLTQTPDEPTKPAEGSDVTDHAGTGREAAEPAEAARPTPDEPDVGTAGEEPEPVEESDEEPGSAAEATGGGAGDESVDGITGIGPAYGKRLADAGVETVADLVAADAAELADSSGISEKRIASWQASAEDRLG